MKFNFTDAWILQSIFSSEKPEQAADLVDIISYADYSNHAILTYAELTNSLPKLITAGLVLQIDNYFMATDLYKTWWDKKNQNKKRIYVFKAIKDTEKYLNKTFGSIDASQIQPTIQVTPETFQCAVDTYINRANNLLIDL